MYLLPSSFDAYKSIEKLLTGGRFSPGKPKFKKLFFWYFVIGLLCLIKSIMLVSTTFIPLPYVIGLLLIPGFVMSYKFKNNLDQIDGRKGHIILHFITHTATTGSTILYLFLYFNIQFSHPYEALISPMKEKIDYIDDDGKYKWYFTYRYNGLNKELSIKNDKEYDIDQYHEFYMEIRKGLFGIKFIDQWRLIN